MYFFVALRKELGEFDFPLRTYSKDSYVTCGDAIGDLPSLDGVLGSSEMEYPCEPLSDCQIKMRQQK